MKKNCTRRELVQRLALLYAISVIGSTAEAEPRAASAYPNLVDMANPLQGTNSNFGFSRGNTLPLVARPFGMNHWSLQTSEGDGWFFDPNARKFQGVRATHQPSPWIGDYGKITFMAQSGEPIYAPTDRAESYRQDDLTVRPHRLSIRSERSRVRTEMTATERGAIFRFTFPSAAKARVIIDAHSHAEVGADKRSISGFSRHKSGGAPNNFACYFHAVFDTPFASATVLNNHQPAANLTTFDAKEVGAAAEFDGVTVIVMRVATSFISVEQAKHNLEREIGSATYDAVEAASAQVWNQTLGIVEIDAGADERERRTFYSCLYRAHLFPRMFHEPDATGQPIHYSPYDGKTHPGVLYTDTGLWDGYRALYPLLSLIQPARFGEMVEGFLNAYREGGWLPQWPSPGTRGGMGGTHSDAVIADALTKDIPGFDRETAYAAIQKDAIVAPGWGVFEGRQQLDAYRTVGFRPNSVSNSLDYAYDDGCVALAAQKLGKTEDFDLLRKSSQNYRRLYDADTGFMRARNADGSWKTPFDPYAWGGPYTEGCAWQWSWAVPHDPGGLMTLMGGQKPFLEKLDRMLLQPSMFHPGGYGRPIHEMLEMAAFPFGQYDQGNQPDHHVLTLFAAAGCPWKTAYWTRRVLDLAYSPDNFPGDEDNGEMGAWYVLNALGIYPLCVGHPSYVIGSPLFREARIHLGGNKALTLRAPKNSRSNVYVNGVRLDGKPYRRLVLDHADLAKGGAVEFDMGPSPVERTVRASDLPFSFSPYPPISAIKDSRQTEIRINCGGETSGDFVGDCFVTGGSAVASDAAGVFPHDGDLKDIYATSRKGDFTYRVPLPMLPANRPYHMRLHYAVPPKTITAGPALSVNGKTIALISDAETRSPSPRATAICSVRDVRPDQDGAIVIVVSGMLYAIEILST